MITQIDFEFRHSDAHYQKAWHVIKHFDDGSQAEEVKDPYGPFEIGPALEWCSNHGYTIKHAFKTDWTAYAPIAPRLALHQAERLNRK